MNTFCVAAFLDELEKIAGLPKYLKDMVEWKWGIPHIVRWPKDKRLVDKLSQWQAGVETRKHFSGPFAESFRENAGKAPEGSIAAIWKKSRESLKQQ